jgi:transposase InsO family protein
MTFVFQPWQLCFVVLAGWVNRQLQEAIEYLRAENRVLRETHGSKRILLNDDQRRRLAVKGTVLARQRLEQIGTLFTPDTILRWHRTLVAKKWGYSERRKSVGRPPVGHEIVDLVVRFARENVTCGYDKIQGALANLGHTISDQTVGNILKEHGIEPAPERKRQTTWKTFLKAHWDCLAAIDFTTVEVWTKGGLVTYYLLFVMELSTRRVHLAACTSSLGDEFMRRIARNLTDPFDGFLTGKRYVLMDRDTSFSSAFRSALEEAGVKSVRLPPKSPNLNAHLERFHLSAKSECLSRMIFFGEKMLRHAAREFLDHYHEERNHQSLGNRIIEPGEEVGRAEGDIICDERLGGMLRYYRRAA